MAVDPIEALIRELATHLRSTFPVAQPPSGSPFAQVREGWPDPDEELYYPTVSIDAPTGGQRSSQPPRKVMITPAGGSTNPDITTRYASALLTVQLQLDVFANDRSSRTDALQAIDTALQAQVGGGSSILRLTLTDYFGRVASYRKSGTSSFDDSAARVGSSEWRATLTVEAEIEEVIDLAEKRLIELQTDLDLRFQVDLEPSPPTESRTVFQPS